MFQKKNTNEEIDNTISFEDLLKRWNEQEQWYKDHKFLGFVRNVFYFFRYRIPFMASDTYHDIRYAYKRVVRGFDDRMVFNMKHEHTNMMISALYILRNTHVGSPVFDYSAKATDDIHEKWNSMLDQMIAGFEAKKMLMEDDDLDEEATKMMERQWKKGMGLFIKHYDSLWD